MASISLVSFFLIILVIFCSILNSQQLDEHVTDEKLPSSRYLYQLLDENKIRIKRDDNLKKQMIKKPTLILKEHKSKTTTAKSVILSTALEPSADTNGSAISSTINTLSTTDSYDLIEEKKATFPPNTSIKEDHHIYYNSTFYSDPEDAMKFWVYPNDSYAHPHHLLSTSYRRASIIHLTFKFPFYGHLLENVTIATGGFLYLGDTYHSWLAATQYIAPLMSNFDTSLSNDSVIHYADNGTAFVVQWNNVMLKDRSVKGSFSFQVTLFNNGDIVFVYKDIPIPLKDIPDNDHPVKVGLSEAYVTEKTVFSCLDFKDCNSCINAKINFECRWCDTLKRCSDGMDRSRQSWISNKCPIDDVDGKANCSLSEITNKIEDSSIPSQTGKSHMEESSNAMDSVFFTGSLERDKSASKGWVSMMVILSLFSGLGLWIFYAYKNPQSSSGQLLIKYRPSRWRLSGSEARYTAASIHM